MKYLVLVFLFFQACRFNCPPDQKIGTVSLAPESLNYFPYKGSEKLIFKNSRGKTIKFYAPQGLIRPKTKIAVHKLCSEFKYDGRTTYQYFEGTGKAIWFKSDAGYAINLGLFTENLKPEQQLFYDKLTVDMMQTGSLGRLSILTKIRFSESYDKTDFYIPDQPVRLKKIKIGLKTFYDVWASKAYDGRQIYYNKAQGLVGFNDGKSSYFLDRITF